MLVLMRQSCVVRSGYERPFYKFDTNSLLSYLIAVQKSVKVDKPCSFHVHCSIHQQWFKLILENWLIFFDEQPIRPRKDDRKNTPLWWQFKLHWLFSRSTRSNSCVIIKLGRWIILPIRPYLICRPLWNSFDGMWAKSIPSLVWK